MPKGVVKFDQKRKDEFLAQLQETGLKNHAARAVGINRNTVYHAMEKDEEFALQVADAMETYREGLIAEAFRRGVQGVEEPLYFQGKLSGDVVRKYSDRLLERLLEAHVPGFGKKVDVEHKHTGGVLVVHSDVQSREDWEKKFGGERIIEGASVHVLPATDGADT